MIVLEAAKNEQIKRYASHSKIGRFHGLTELSTNTIKTRFDGLL